MVMAWCGDMPRPELAMRISSTVLRAMGRSFCFSLMVTEMTVAAGCAFTSCRNMLATSLSKQRTRSQSKVIRCSWLVSTATYRTDLVIKVLLFIETKQNQQRSNRSFVELKIAYTGRY